MFKRTKSLRPVAVVDTNVLLDLHSMHDFRQVEELVQLHGDAAFDHAKTTYRLARARDALLLGMHLSKNNLTTWSLHSELLEKIL